jgi:hypothetical protein
VATWRGTRPYCLFLDYASASDVDGDPVIQNFVTRQAFPIAVYVFSVPCFMGDATTPIVLRVDKIIEWSNLGSLISHRANLNYIYSKISTMICIIVG